MKIIDLLNKIANGEDVPKRIRYCSVNYKYDVYDYFNEDKDDDGDGDARLSYWIDFDKKALNDEVKIIGDTPKEDKKINRIERKARNLTNQYIKDKLNEIIDKINGE